MNSTVKRKRFSLDEILLDSDSFGLLNVKPLKALTAAQSVVVERFEAIQSFVDKYARIPDTVGDFAEKQLARRLSAILKDTTQHAELASYDRHNLLPKSNASILIEDEESELNALMFSSESLLRTESMDQVENAITLDDVFLSDSFGLLDVSAHQEHADIFTITHVKPKPSSKSSPDVIAKRTTCKNFGMYQTLFTALAENIEEGAIEVVPYQRTLHQIQKSDVYILYNVMCYVADIGESLEGYDGYNARVHVIFANGQEAFMLYQSFSAGLKRRKNGKKVKVSHDMVTQLLSCPVESTGYIYVLKSLSDDPVITVHRNLYKIGYTELAVEERIQNAHKDKTFLEAPVKIVETYACQNLNPQKLESFIHSFLSSRRLNINITALDGSKYSPKEWFDVPIETIENVIFAIIDGSITKYRLDKTTGDIVLKNNLS